MSCMELAKSKCMTSHGRILESVIYNCIDNDWLCWCTCVPIYTLDRPLDVKSFSKLLHILKHGTFFLKAWHVCLKTVSVVGLDKYYVCILSVILQIQYQMPSWKLKDDAVRVKHCWWFVLRNLQWSQFLLKVAYIPSSQLHVRDMWGQ